MQQVFNIDLEMRPLSGEEIAHWLMENSDLQLYRPVARRDCVSPYSFSMRAVDGFASWQGSSAASRQFDVGLNGDNFMFFFEESTSYVIKSGSARHGLCSGRGLIISADRYEGIDISELSRGGGFVVSRAAITKALVHTYQRPVIADFGFAPVLDLGNGPMARIISLMHYLRDNVLSQPDLVVSPLAVASFREMLCLLMIENLEHSYSRFDLFASRIAPTQVRKAREFLHAQAHLPITIADVAEAAGVSVRALQVNFRAFLDTTPMLYLHLVRLNGVHHDLKRALPKSTTVAEVARRWGFVHMGRFALEYRAKFGVKPSDDLGRGYQF